MPTAVSFHLPDSLSATAPPERQGRPRDAVRLLVVDRESGAFKHSEFRRLGDHVRAGDLLVFNASRTVPAVLQGKIGDEPVEIRLARRLPNGSWLVLLIGPSGSALGAPVRQGSTIRFEGGLEAIVGPADERDGPLWKLTFSRAGQEFWDRLYRTAQPVRYSYVPSPWPLEDYQTVFSRVPGSVEMPSAGRPFTWRTLFDLHRCGVQTTSIVLHCGLSSYLDNAATKEPAEEAYQVSAESVRTILEAKSRGGRVIAVGTTVVRALESAALASPQGALSPVQGSTRLKIGRDHRLRVADGLLTGMHEPQSSHLDLLSAFIRTELLQAAYESALSAGYLWHEFGDVNLILPMN